MDKLYFLATILCVLLFTFCENSKHKKKSDKILQKTTIENVKQSDGLYLEKHDNGQIKIKGEILQNKRIGIWTSYYKNGIKQSENTYIDGVLSGKTVSFYTNGQVRYIGYFIKNKKDGKWNFYSKQGDLDKTLEYKGGELVDKSNENKIVK